MSLAHPTEYRFRHYREGRLLWASSIGDVDAQADELEVVEAQLWTPNAIADEGEQWILDTFFRGAAAPAGFFLRLATAAPTDTSTLATVSQVTGTGYAPIAVARNTTDWPTLALNAGDFRVVMATKTFTATGTWTAATHMYLATTSDNTGKLISYAALGTTRTLVNGDTLAVDYNVTAS